MHLNEWANALDRFWGDLEPGSRALLMLEPRLLMHVADKAGFKFDSVEEVETDFLSAVRVYLRGKVHRPWHAEPYHLGTPPRFLLQIAVQVYAASKMADAPDGHHTDRAYYVQLEDLVGDLGTKERFNQNDQGEFHQQLWRERLDEWAREKKLVLQLPEDHQGAFRHVQLPKSQAVLRIGDLERLPIFFSRCGFRPAVEAKRKAIEAQLSRVESQLRIHQHDVSCFSSWARSVLDDRHKFPIAVIQVEEALSVWDGRLHIRDAGRRPGKEVKRNRWVWIAIQSRQQRIKALGGTSVATATAISSDQLAALLDARQVGEDQFTLQDGLALFRYDQDVAAFKQVECLEAGDRGLFASGSQSRTNLNRIIDAEDMYHDPRVYAASVHEKFEKLDGIPEGCLLADLRVVDRLPPVSDIPEIWRKFLRSPRSGLWLGGGLRIDRKEQWVTGAGPYLKISGNFLPTFITVDGQRIPINGRVVRLDRFSATGNHEIVASFDGQRHVKRFSVGLPSSAVANEFPNRCWQFSDDQWPVFDSGFVVAADQAETPKLSGVRGESLTRCAPETVASDTDDRLIAIRLLAGIPVTAVKKFESGNPLVRYLINDQRLVHARRKLAP